MKNIFFLAVSKLDLKMKKPMLCCFEWIVFLELNFAVAFLLIRKTWDDRFVSKMGGWRVLINGGGNDLRTMNSILWRFTEKIDF